MSKHPTYASTGSVVSSAATVGRFAGGAAVLGAVAGGAAAAASSAIKVNKGEMTRKEAVKHVACEAGSTGVATGVGVAVVGGLGLGSLLSIAGVAVVATGVKYALNNMAAKKKTCNKDAPVAVNDKEAEAAS